eukprot:6455850-Amphidinium_carterae.1
MAEAELLAVLGKHIHKPRDIPHYSSDMRSKVEKRLLLAHKKLLGALFDINPKLSFQAVELEGAFQKLSRNQKWQIKNEDSRECMAKVAAQRIRVMSRHLSQSILKARRCHTSWVVAIVGKERRDEEEDEETDGEDLEEVGQGVAVVQDEVGQGVAVGQDEVGRDHVGQYPVGQGVAVGQHEVGQDQVGPAGQGVAVGQDHAGQ